MYQPATANAPSARLVVIHFATGGIVFFILLWLSLFWAEAFVQHYFNPHLLAITHLLVLGWISMVIFGALYQLLPVILEVRLYSEKLGYLTWVLLLCGTFSLAHSFHTFNLGGLMHLAATLLGFAVLLFAINVLLTIHQTKKSSIERDFIQTAVVWFAFTAGAGILLAINLRYPLFLKYHIELLKLHAHAGMAGWFLQLIMGVGSKLLPMFMVSHGLSKKRLTVAYYNVNMGLIGLIIGFYHPNFALQIAGSLGLATGIILFILYLAEAFRKRVRRVLDTGMWQSVASLMILPVLLLPAAWFLAGTPILPSFTQQVAIVYGFVILGGFISGLILGQTYKTLPFIVWLREYRTRVGKQKVPLPRELYSENVAFWQFRMYSLSLLVFASGILLRYEWVIRSGALLAIVAVTLYLTNVFKIIFHKAQENERTKSNT